MTNPGEGSGNGDLAKIDNDDDQSPAQTDYIVLYASTPVVFDRMTLQKIGADSDARIWIANVAAEPTSINQAFLDSLYTEYLPDGGGPTRIVNFNGGNLAGNLLILAPKQDGVNDSFFLKSVTFTCPPTGPVNLPPDAVNDGVTVIEDSGANTINVLANDSDADGGTLTITAVTQPTGSAGAVVNNGSNVSFTPATNFAGPTSFTYTISDGQGGSDTATVNVTVTPVNDAPVAIDDSYSTNEDVVLNVPAPGVLGNDMDVDGPSLSAVLGTTTSNGTLSFDGNGSFSYTPNANFSGSDSFSYRASDGSLQSNLATVNITINAVNDGPDAVNDAATVAEDSSGNVIDVRANDTDPESNALVVTAVSDPANGTATVGLDGANVIYTPDTDFSGSDSFTYTISDGQGGTDSATVTLTVTSVNDAPLALNDGYSTPEDTVLNVTAPGVLQNDTDADGDALSSILVAGPTASEGSLVLNSDGSFAFTPAANFNGSASFTYKANDGTVDSNVATVTINVTAGNDAPTADNDSYTADEDAVLNVPAPGVLDGDSDPDGNTLSAIVVASPANGVMVLNADGSFSYTPHANFNGVDMFTYKANDGALDSNIATVTITVNAINDAPAALNDSYVTDEDVALSVPAPGVLGNDTDVDGGSLSAMLVTGPANGTLTLGPDGSFTYTPGPDFSGTDSFSYKANDGSADSNVATASITVNPIQDSAGQLLINEVEIDPPSISSDACQYIEIRGQNVGGVVPAGTYFLSVNSDSGNPGFANVAVNIGGAVVGSNGTITILNTAYSGGCSRSFPPGTTVINYANALSVGKGSETYLIAHSSTNLFTGQDLDANNDGEFEAALDIGMISDGFALLVNPEEEWVYGASAGVVNISNTIALDQPDGVTRFIDDTTPFAAAAFYYGEIAESPDEATLYISPKSPNTPTCAALTPGAPNEVVSGCVEPTPTPTPTPTPNNPPNARNDSATVAEDSVDNIINVLVNDDTGGDGPSPLVITAATNGSNGVVVNNGTDLSYTPNANFFGSDSFSYTISDGADSASATVNITVGAVNDAPVAVNDSYSTNQDTTLNISAPGVLGNDADIDADSLSAVIVSSPLNGSLSLNSNGSFSYTPNAGFTGSDSFTYRANDGAADSNLATVSIAVDNVNDAPVALNDSYSTSEDGALNVPAPGVLGNDSDADGNPLTALIAVGPANGSLILNADGSFTYTPNANFNGSDSFTYRASDGTLQSNIATVSITVSAVNDVPDAVNDSASVAEDSSNNIINVLANDTDPDGNTLSIIAVTQPANGSVVNSGTDAAYTPNANFTGTDTFSYTVSDGNGGTDTATVTVSVGGVNDSPDAVDDATTVAEDSSANVINVLANDSDPDGDSLTVSAVTQGANGSVVNNGSNVAYTPNANVNGSDTFTYTISDGNGGTDTATVTITVTAVNDAPDAVDDAATVAEDSMNNIIDVLVNDTDADGNTLTITVVTQGVNGSVVSNGNNVSYTPNANYFGPDSFTYTISDGNGGMDTATVSITVTDVPDNQSPDAVNDAAMVLQNSSGNLIDVLANDTDPDAGQTLTITAVTQGANGSVVNNGNNVSYTPTAGFVGSDSFTYTISDGNGGTDTATVNVSVAQSAGALVINEVEIDTPDTSGNEGCQYIEVRAANPGGTIPLGTYFLSINSDSGNFGFASVAISLGGAVVGTNGLITLINTQQSGCAGRTYDPGSSILNYSSATLLGGNPITGSESYLLVLSTASLLNGVDLDVDDNGFIDPAFGIDDETGAGVLDGFALLVNPDEEYVYGAVAGVMNVSDSADTDQPDAVTRQLTNTAAFQGFYLGELAASPANTVTYASPGTFPPGAVLTPGAPNYAPPANQAPSAVDDSATVAEDSSNNVINVLANDSDPDAGQTLTISGVGVATNGAIMNNGNNVSYTPNPNYFGADSFTYTISDGNGGTDTATVNITVTDVPDNTPPNAVDDSATVNENSSNNIINVLANDTDPDTGQTLNVTAAGPAANGSVVNNGTNVSYTPNAGFDGSDSFTYTMSDGNGGTDTAIVNVTVTPAASPAGQLLINEAEIDTPDTSGNEGCQYIEIRGQNPGGVIPMGTYFLSVNSDAGNFGFASVAVNLGGAVVGSNGTITLINTLQGGCAGRSYPVGTTIINYASNTLLGGNPITGSETFLLVTSTANLLNGVDLDTDDDGLFDPAFGIDDVTGAGILDGFALLVNPDEEYVYGAAAGAVNVSDSADTDQPDAVGRLSTNTVPFQGFYVGELAASPANTTTYATPGNFPAGAVLTPGAPNVP